MVDTGRWLIRPLALEEVERVTAVLGLARLHQGDGFYLVAWEGDEPLGHVYLALTDPPELHDVSVRTEHRRRGVASTLIAAAEREVPRHAPATGSGSQSASITSRRRPCTGPAATRRRLPAEACQGDDRDPHGAD